MKRLFVFVGMSPYLWWLSHAVLYAEKLHSNKDTLRYHQIDIKKNSFVHLVGTWTCTSSCSTRSCIPSHSSTSIETGDACVLLRSCYAFFFDLYALSRVAKRVFAMSRLIIRGNDVCHVPIVVHRSGVLVFVWPVLCLNFCYGTLSLKRCAYYFLVACRNRGDESL